MAPNLSYIIEIIYRVIIRSVNEYFISSNKISPLQVLLSLGARNSRNANGTLEPYLFSKIFWFEKARTSEYLDWKAFGYFCNFLPIENFQK